MNNLTIALSKGRIFKDTLPLLKHCGIEPNDDPVTSRKLKLDTNLPNVKLLVLRSTDVPSYVQHGVADLGVAGKDVLLEQELDNLYEPLNLHFAKCRMITAKVKGVVMPNGKIKVATKYPEIAKKFFNQQGRQAEIIKLYGAIELAPLVGLSDCIVDLVETGKTLDANELEVWQHITDVSAQLIVNKAAMKIKHKLIKQLIKKISLYIGSI